MPQVKILPPDVISKIAAGEVVDRPSSVVKELMENALDAGATKLEIVLKAGGKSLIRVKDNGTGIARADLEKMFVRHATSKIASAEDLEALASLGFRGEALYSIAAVSEVLVRTRGAQGEAWEIFLRGGKRERLIPAALAERGSEVSVEEIFFNTPARKKFLKADSSELDAVINVFLPYALQLPHIHFVLTNNDRVLYDLPPAETLAARAARALNLTARHIVEETAEIKDEGIRVQLVLGDINIQRPRRDQQYLFVNGRPVQHKNLAFHVNDVYRLIMPDGVHPFFVVFIDVPPSEVDVNIHPQKREVRLKPEARVVGLLRSSVERALMTKGGAKETGGTLSEPLFTFEPGLGQPSQGVPSEKIVFGPGQKGLAPASFPRQERQPDFGGAFGQASPAPAAFEETPPERSLKDRLVSARFVGTFACKYHLFEESNGLFAVDQHAAQERILFERFLAQASLGPVEVQTLLAPVVVRLSPQEMVRWEQAREFLKQMGFETSPLSPEAVSVHAYPRLLKRPEMVLRSLLVDDAALAADRNAFARRACRASVMAGDPMSAEEALHQIKDLAACQDPMTCPHGRPVFIEFKMSFFDRHFLRPN